MRPWTCLSREKVLKGKIFAYEQHHYKSADSDKEGRFDIIKVVDWVNMVVLTKNDELLLVEQFRAGSNSLTFEIPGGAVDVDEKDPLKAAIRELSEETGYSAQNWQEIGVVEPNPAFLNNRCFTYFADQAELTGKQNLDPLEEISVHAIPLPKVGQMIEEGKITHSLVIAAFYWLYRLRGENPWQKQ